MYRIRFHLKIYKNMKEKSALNQTKMFICYLKQKLFHGFKRRNSKTYDDNVAESLDGFLVVKIKSNFLS